MRVVLANGERLERHYTLDLPLMLTPTLAGGRANAPERADIFQSNGARKAVALWYYTEKAKQLLRARRDSRGLHRGVAAFKSYFEAAARECGDERNMLAEVALWDQLVEVKTETLTKGKKGKGSACAIM